MILGQALEASGSYETLRHHDADGERYLVLLSGRPSIDILQKSRESRLFQRLLKIFVSENRSPTALVPQTGDSGGSPYSPPDQLVLHIDVLLELVRGSGVLGVYNGPRTNR